MDIATPEHRVAGLVALQGGQHALAGGHVAVPAVGPVALRLGLEIALFQWRDQQILGNDIPLSGRLGEAAVQPGFLFPTEHGAFRVTQIRTITGRDVTSTAAVGLDAGLL